MIPKKSSKLYNTVSEDLNININLVQDLVEYSYKELRTLLTNLEHPRVNMEGLGHFVAKTTLIRKDIPRYKQRLENHDTSTFGAYYNKKVTEVKLDLLIKLEEKIATQENKKNIFKKTKDENSTKDNLGE
jgi:hypothetical protein